MTTLVGDLSVEPITFREYVHKLILKKSALFRSGVIGRNGIDVPTRGKTVNAPSFLGLTGSNPVLSDTVPLVPNKVDSINAVSVIQFRGDSWAVNDLTTAIAGEDPMGNLAEKIANYWVREYNKVTLATITGSAAALDAEFGAGSILNAVGGPISADAVIDTKQLMGEYGTDLTKIVMHSAVFSSLLKTDLTKDIIIDSDGSPLRTSYSYQGLECIIDDTLVDNAGTFTSYLTGEGAVSFNQASDASKYIEGARDILAGNDTFSTRNRFMMHPMGSSFTNASVAGIAPSNAELENVANWEAEDAGEDKRYKIRGMIHTL